MDEKNRFFRFLNRVNSVLLALAGLAILLFIGSNLFFWPSYFEHPAAGPAHVEQADPDISYNFAGGLNMSDTSTITMLDGTSEGAMLLQRNRKERYESFSSGGGQGPSDDVNVLIIDTVTGRSHWLFHGVKQSLGVSYPIRAAAAPGAVRRVIALLMTVATADTNHDGRIDGADENSLYIYRPGTDRAVKLLGAKAISNVAQTDPERVLVTYYDGKTDRLAIFSTADFKPVAQNAISNTPD